MTKDLAMHHSNNFSFSSTTDPVVIKKIAIGTAADESGQLRVGDILLEVFLSVTVVSLFFWCFKVFPCQMRLLCRGLILDR